MTHQVERPLFQRDHVLGGLAVQLVDAGGAHLVIRGDRFAERLAVHPLERLDGEVDQFVERVGDDTAAPAVGDHLVEVLHVTLVRLLVGLVGVLLKHVGVEDALGHQGIARLLRLDGRFGGHPVVRARVLGREPLALAVHPQRVRGDARRTGPVARIGRVAAARLVSDRRDLERRNAAQGVLRARLERHREPVPGHLGIALPQAPHVVPAVAHVLRVARHAAGREDDGGALDEHVRPVGLAGEDAADLAVGVEVKLEAAGAQQDRNAEFLRLGGHGGRIALGSSARLEPVERVETVTRPTIVVDHAGEPDAVVDHPGEVVRRVLHDVDPQQVVDAPVHVFGLALDDVDGFDLDTLFYLERRAHARDAFGAAPPAAGGVALLEENDVRTALRRLHRSRKAGDAPADHHDVAGDRLVHLGRDLFAEGVAGGHRTRKRARRRKAKRTRRRADERPSVHDRTARSVNAVHAVKAVPVVRRCHRRCSFVQ